MKRVVYLGLILLPFTLFALTPPHGFGPANKITDTTTVDLVSIDYGGGKWVVAYGDSGSIKYAISSDGTNWNTGIVILPSGSTDYYQPVVKYLGFFSGQYKWLAVFRRDIGTEVDVVYSIGTDNGTSMSWTSPVVVASYMSSDSALDNNPWVAVDLGIFAGNDSTVIIAWESNIQQIGSTNYGGDKDIFYVECTYSGGNSFSSCSSVAALNSDATTDATYDEKVALETDDNGNWIAVWGRTNGVAYSRKSGGSWSNVAILDSSYVNIGAYPLFSIAWRLNTVLVFWITDAYGGPDFGIVYKKSTDDGVTFGAAVSLYEANGGFVGSVRSNVSGTKWGVIFETNDSVTTCGQGVGSDYDIFVLFSDDANSWSDPNCLAINDYADTDATGVDDNSPDLAPSITSGGSWVAVWNKTQTNDLMSTFSSTVPVKLKQFVVE